MAKTRIVVEHESDAKGKGGSILIGFALACAVLAAVYGYAQPKEVMDLLTKIVMYAIK